MEEGLRAVRDVAGRPWKVAGGRLWFATILGERSLPLVFAGVGCLFLKTEGLLSELSETAEDFAYGYQ